MIRVVCPSCERMLGLAQATVGAVGVCPSCGQRFRIPSLLISIPEPEPPDSPRASRPPPAPGPLPANAYFTMPTREAAADAADFGRDQPPPRRRRRRDASRSNRAQRAQAGRALVILLVSLIGAIEVLDNLIVLVHNPDPIEFLGSLAVEMTPEEQAEFKKEMSKDRVKDVVKSLGAALLIGILLALVCMRKNGGRIALAIVLFLRTAGNTCCGLLVFVAVPAFGFNLKALLPELVVFGLMIAIYPTVAITLLASESIKAYCDA